VHLVGFIIRIYHDARSPKYQIDQHSLNNLDDETMKGRYDTLLCVHFVQEVPTTHKK